MNTLNISKYGYPLAEGYTINTDLALARTTAQSDWVRQRRTFLHNASLITMTWRLRQDLAHDLVAWLNALPIGDFFACDLLTGNDTDAPCGISTTLIRRTSGIVAERIPYASLFKVGFSAETKEQVGYKTKASAVADQPPLTYPPLLPLPKATGFTEAHGSRNITNYTLTYRMDTATLADWLAFAGFAGTAWFYHPMFSTNIACASELVRYIAAPAQTLVGPNTWEVSIAAETMPVYTYSGTSTEPTDECTYDSLLEYNDSTESYDCDGGTTPPQGDFVVPTGVFTQSKVVTGATTATADCILQLKSNGAVVSTPTGSPSWVAWHTDAQSLVSPAIKLDKVIEFSRDGINWTFYTPTVSGVWLSLKTDLWLRVHVSGNYDKTTKLTFRMTFNAEASVSPFAVDYPVNCSMTSTIDITAPTDGIVGGVDYTDGQIIQLEPDDVLPTVSAGILLHSDGTVVSAVTNQPYLNWFNPTTIGIGGGYWVQAVKSSGINTLSSGRTQLTSGVRYRINNRSTNANDTSVECSWHGVINFYTQSQGGSIIASSTLNLYSKASL